MTLKQLYSWPKKPYQFMTNLFFLANIPTPGQVQHQVDKNFTSSYFGSWLNLQGGTRQQNMEKRLQ